MAFGNHDGLPMVIGNGDENMEIHIVVNGEEIDGLPEGIMQHLVEMIGSGVPHEGMEGMRDRMMEMHGGPEGMEGMRDRMMEMRGGPEGMEGMRDRMMGQMNGAQREWQERDTPEIVEFMHELGLLGEVADYLANSESIALLGIQMIRDELEGEVKISALERVIEEAAQGSPSRNAAILVLLEVMQEEGDDEGAADLMVELVLSN